MVVLAIVFVVSGCGSLDSGIRDEGGAAIGDEAVVSPAASVVAAGQSTTPAPAPGMVIVYFLRYDEPRPTHRSVSSGLSGVETSLQQLLLGPSSAERSLSYSTAIPERATLLALSVVDRVAIVDLSELPVAKDDRDQEALLALYQVVYTVTAGGGVDAAMIRVKGRPYGLASITGGSSESEPPLTRADLSFVVATESLPGSTGCAVVQDPAVPFVDEPLLDVTRPLDGAIVRTTIQVRGRVLSTGGPIVIRILQDGIEVTHRIIDENCRGKFSASLPVPRALAGEAVLDVSAQNVEGTVTMQVRRTVTIVD